MRRFRLTIAEIYFAGVLSLIIYALLLMVAIRGVRDLALFVWAYVVASALLVWMALFLFDMKAAYGTNMGLLGTIDELRIASTARSAGWIATEFANQSSPATFYTVGAEQPAP